MKNYFYDLPYDIIYYINTISSKIIIQKYISERLIKKKDLITKLIFDLSSRQSNINLDFYTFLIINNINKLFFGNELYGNNPLIDQKIWSIFLWKLYSCINNINKLYFKVNNGSELFNDIENIYYELRVKTSRYGLLNNGIEYLFNLPPYITMETNYDFVD